MISRDLVSTGDARSLGTSSSAGETSQFEDPSTLPVPFLFRYQFVYNSIDPTYTSSIPPHHHASISPNHPLIASKSIVFLKFRDSSMTVESTKQGLPSWRRFPVGRRMIVLGSVRWSGRWMGMEYTESWIRVWGFRRS